MIEEQKELQKVVQGLQELYGCLGEIYSGMRYYEGREFPSPGFSCNLGRSMDDLEEHIGALHRLVGKEAVRKHGAADR